MPTFKHRMCFNLIADRESHQMELCEPRRSWMDRRSGVERRRTYLIDYFDNGGIERRSGLDRRQQADRRRMGNTGCSSVAP